MWPIYLPGLFDLFEDLSLFEDQEDLDMRMDIYDLSFNIIKIVHFSDYLL